MLDTAEYNEMTKEDLAGLVMQIKTSRNYPYVVDLGHDGVFTSAQGLYGFLHQGPENAITFESLWHTECHAFKYKQYLIVYDPLHGYQRFVGK